MIPKGDSVYHKEHKKWATIPAAALGVALLVILVVAVASAKGAAAYMAAGNQCAQVVSRSGYYHAECTMEQPSGWHIVGYAYGTYRLRLIQACYSRSVSAQLGSSAIATAHTLAVNGTFDVSAKDFKADYNRLITADHCTLDLTVSRLRAGTHHLQAVLTYNYVHALHVSA